MRFGGYMVGLALVVAVTWLGLGNGTEGAGPFDPVGAEAVPNDAEAAVREVAPWGSAVPDRVVSGTEVRETSEAVQEVPPQEAPSSQRSWRSRRNRYPGPIPTPDEWEPPPGPVRIGVQVGHWKTEDAPRELSGLRRNGTRWQNKAEWEVNLAIAQEVVALLEEEGYEVDLLPAVVPPSYRAHLFIAIHADGSNDSSATGFRVAAPRRDATGRASDFVALLEDSYGRETGLRQLPDVTRRMRSYYAFNFRRYEHALHPMTIGVILETGFLTSARDREVIMDDPGRPARGIVEAVKAYEVTPPPGVGGGK